MNFENYQMRSLTVCKVSLEPKQPAERSKLLSKILNKKNAVEGQECLFILSSDRITVLCNDADALIETDHSLKGASSSLSYSTLADETGPLLTLPLSVLHRIQNDGRLLELDHSLPSVAGLTAWSTSSSFSGLPAEEGSSHFPVLGSSFAAINRLVKSSNSDKKHNIFRVFTEDEATASELVAAIRSAQQRLFHAHFWLDKGLPLDVNSSLSISTISIGPPDLQSSPNESMQISGQYVVARASTWGSIVQIPQELANDTIHLDLSTPLGPCHAKVPISKLLNVNSEDYITLHAACLAPKAVSNLSVNVKVAAVVETRNIDDYSQANGDDSAFPGSGKQKELTSDSVGSLDSDLLVIGIALAILAAVILSKGSWWEGCCLAFLSITLCFKNNFKRSIPSSANATEGSQPRLQGLPPLGLKSSKTLKALHLVAAEIVEGSGPTSEEDEEDDVAPLPEKLPQRILTRKLTRSLTARSNYLAATPTSRAGLVDFGAVSLRRVITTTSRSVTVEGEAAAVLISAKTRPSSAAKELAAIQALAALSPAITPALFERYIVACSGDRQKALERLKATAEWRKSMEIDAVLHSPAPHFKQIKAAYLHSLVGYTRDGTMPVVVEGMGAFKAALNQLRKQNMTAAELIQQFILVMEWILRDLSPGDHPSGCFVRIYDLKGIRLMDLADKEAISLGQQMMDILEKYYPERMAYAFVVNTPSFFATAWKMVRPLLDPRTAKKIRVLSNSRTTLDALRELMADDVIPAAYGGKNPAAGYDLGFEKWYELSEERRLAGLVDELNQSVEE